MIASESTPKHEFRKIVPISELRKVLHYDPFNGLFYWKILPNRKMKNRFVTGVGHRDLYARVVYNGYNYLAHRVAWALYYGEWPTKKQHIDHINGDPYDNRIVNLRDVPVKQNARNRRQHREDGKLFGAHLRKATGKWQASLNYRGENVYLGQGDTAAAAHKMVVEFLNSKGDVNNGQYPAFR